MAPAKKTVSAKKSPTSKIKKDRLTKRNIKADIDAELEALKEDHFRVAIFGSARVKLGSEIYEQTFELGRQIAAHDIDIVTGGGPGIMEAANKGHDSVDNGTRAYSIGVGIDLPWEQKMNDYVQVQKEFRKFSRRLDQFMVLSNAVVVMPGGIGTCLELFYTWQLTQVGHICKIPIIVVGENWRKLILWVKQYLLAQDLMSAEDFRNVFVAQDNDEVMQILSDVYDHHKQDKEFLCNVHKYDLEDE